MQIFAPAASKAPFVMAMTFDVAFLMNKGMINVTSDPGNDGNYSQRTYDWQGSVLRYQITQRRNPHHCVANL